MIVVRVFRERERERGPVREIVCRRLPVTLGRGAECDVVLVDPSVSRTHARIEAVPEGGVTLRDLGSRNGIRVGPRRVDEVAVTGPVRCRLGRAEIELDPVSDAATVEVSAAEWQRLNRRRGVTHHVASLLLGVAGWAAFAVLQPEYWSPWQKQRLVTLLSSVLAAAILVPILAFVLLVVLRAVGRGVRLGDALRTVGLLAWLAPLARLLEMPAYYVLSPSGCALVGEVVEILAITVAVVTAASIRRVGPSTRFRLAWAAAVLVLSSGFWVVSTAADRRSGAPAVDYRVQPPLLGWAGRSQSIDGLLDDVDAATEQAQREAAEVRVRQNGEPEP